VGAALFAQQLLALIDLRLVGLGLALDRRFRLRRLLQRNGGVLVLLVLQDVLRLRDAFVGSLLLLCFAHRIVTVGFRHRTGEPERSVTTRLPTSPLPVEEWVRPGPEGYSPWCGCCAEADA
jgi:hypothetical protein